MTQQNMDQLAVITGQTTMIVDEDTINEAIRKLYITKNAAYRRSDWLEITGITESEWRRCLNNGKLHTSKRSAAIVEAAAIYGDSPHWPTILKAVEARFKTHEQETDAL